MRPEKFHEVPSSAHDFRVSTWNSGFQGGSCGPYSPADEETENQRPQKSKSESQKYKSKLRPEPSSVLWQILFCFGGYGGTLGSGFVSSMHLLPRLFPAFRNLRTGTRRPRFLGVLVWNAIVQSKCRSFQESDGRALPYFAHAWGAPTRSKPRFAI